MHKTDAVVTVWLGNKICNLNNELNTLKAVVAKQYSMKLNSKYENLYTSLQK